MQEYFVSRTDIVNDCWIWKLATNSQGHGICTHKFSGAKKSYTAHRLSYIMHIGPIDDGLVVRHLCSNKGCCNPQHLTIGTQSDNYYDMSEEQRRKLHIKSGETTKRTGVLKGKVPWNKGSKCKV